jgi:hypothetical protein
MEYTIHNASQIIFPGHAEAAQILWDLINA